ncbi:MAG: glycosyltransferase [Promethearchaeota archaeon]
MNSLIISIVVPLNFILLNLFSFIVKTLFEYLNNIYFFVIGIILIILYFFLVYYLRDIKHIKNFKKNKDIDTISLTSLKFKPQINIIIPAWNEGSIFEKCLTSVNNLKYPNLKIIVNAGGNEETIRNAEKFKKSEKFVILRQKGGSRPSLGKIRAINECLEYVTGGIVYFIDADSYINDEIFLRMIFPLINQNEDIVFGGVRPLKEQENNNFVKYLLIDRFRYKFSRYTHNKLVAGQNFCLKYEVLKSIGRFTENRKFATDRSIGIDIFSKGYRAYNLIDFRHRIFVDYSEKIKDYIHQKIIWVENSLIYLFKCKKVLKLLKFLIVWTISLFIIIFPIIGLLNLFFFYLGFLCIIFLFLSKIKKYIIFRELVIKPYKIYNNFNITFFFLLFFYIFLETIIMIIIPFHFISFVLKIKNNLNK